MILTRQVQTTETMSQRFFLSIGVCIMINTRDYALHESPRQSLLGGTQPFNLTVQIPPAALQAMLLEGQFLRLLGCQQWCCQLLCWCIRHPLTTWGKQPHSASEDMLRMRVGTLHVIQYTTAGTSKLFHPTFLCSWIHLVCCACVCLRRVDFFPGLTVSAGGIEVRLPLLAGGQVPHGVHERHPGRVPRVFRRNV